MSPARSKRQPIPHRRSRADIVQAVAVAAGIVLVTSLLIWLMRPGPAGIPATGGLMNRQPRASWLVGTALGVVAIAGWFILSGRRRTRERARVLLPIVFGVVLVGAVIGGFVWPGGLLRHDVAPAPAPTTTTTTTKPGTKSSTSTTSAGGSTTTPGATTTPPGATTAPAATTTPTTVTPTTGAGASPSTTPGK